MLCEIERNISSYINTVLNFRLFQVKLVFDNHVGNNDLCIGVKESLSRGQTSASWDSKIFVISRSPVIAAE